MAPSTRKVSAASARSHTRRNHKRSSYLSPGIYKSLGAILLAGIFAWTCPAFLPPPPKICGSPNGPPVMAPRIILKDGRHLAYKEHGVPKETAKYKIVFIHGFRGCRHDLLHLSSELVENRGIYFLSFDRPGYGESDPDPRRSDKSIALDVEELADKIGLGPTFYVMGFSMGGQAVWGCLKYIPHRLAGAMLIAPVVNYWWPGFPANTSKVAFNQQLVQDQWTLRVAHYLPWLTYWWNTQKLFPSSSVVAAKPDILTPSDKALLYKCPATTTDKTYKIQQGEFESLHRDIIVGFGKWTFDPLKLENPFPSNERYVHLWHGDEDRMVPVLLQRYIAEKLPWIRYKELAGAGHLFPLADGMFDEMVETLLH